MSGWTPAAPTAGSVPAEGLSGRSSTDSAPGPSKLPRSCRARGSGLAQPTRAALK